MEKGAIGMSSGLGYVPGIHCTKNETFKSLTPHKIRVKEYVFTGSDGCAVPELAMYSQPRSTATFAMKLKHFALEKGVLTLQNAILSMTSRPAEKFGIRERGKIIPGYYADLCVIDPATLAAPATYEKIAYPAALPIVSRKADIIQTIRRHPAFPLFFRSSISPGYVMAS